MMKEFITGFIGVLLLWSLCACQSEKPENAEAISEEAHGDELPSNRVAIPATVRKNLGITFAKVERRKIGGAVRVPGVFELEPSARRDYRLMMSGRVELAVKELEEVQEGQLLFQVEAPVWRELQGQIDVARAVLDEARAKLAAVESRKRALEREGFQRAELTMEEEKLRAEALRTEAELVAVLEQARRVLGLFGPAPSRESLFAVKGEGRLRYQTIERLEVRALKAGVVEKLGLTDGAFGEETDLVIRVVQPERVRFRAQVLQVERARLSSQKTGMILSPSGEQLPVNLRLGLQGDAAQRTMEILATPLESREWARAGLTGELEIVKDGEGFFVLAIPKAAVLKDGLTHVFFKRDTFDANRAVRVEADLGADDGRWVEIRSDLGPQDEVVLEGAYELKLATTQSGGVQKGGHFHADGTFHADDH